MLRYIIPIVGSNETARKGKGERKMITTPTEIRQYLTAETMACLERATNWARVGTTEMTVFGPEEITLASLQEYAQRYAAKLTKATALCAKTDAELIVWWDAQ